MQIRTPAAPRARGAPDGTPPALRLSLFGRRTDTRPRPVRVTWDELAARLTGHRERREKDGPCWSPVVYRPGAARGNAGVRLVTALAGDVDHAEPAWPLLDGFAFAAHTTHSHRPGDPRWRVVLPLARAVPKSEWFDVWRRAVHRLLPAADAACKDPARLHYWPACPPGAPRDARAGVGTWLDPNALAPAPVAPAREPAGAPAGGADPPAPVVGAGGRPGDDFNAQGVWRAVLEPHGWRLVSERGDEAYWRRPGKGNGVSATTGYGGSGLLYVFSSNAPPFAPAVAYTKFAAYALLEYGGDFAAAARALAARGYAAPATVSRAARRSDGALVHRLPPPVRPRGVVLPPPAHLHGVPLGVAHGTGEPRTERSR